MSEQMKAVGDLVQWFTDATDANVTFRLVCTKNPQSFLAEIWYFNHEWSEGAICRGEWKKTAPAAVASMLKDAPRTNKAAVKLAEYVRQGKQQKAGYEGNARDPQGYEIPAGLSEAGRDAAEAIVSYLLANDDLYSGGGTVFYTPAQWAERGEEYGLESELIVVHDGGSHAAYFNPDYEAYELYDGMNNELKRVGVYPEQQTGWYSAIYLVPARKGKR